MALVATILMGSGWSTGALGATTTEEECDALRNLQRLEAPAEALSASQVDHVSIDADASSIESLEASSASSETGAPFLYLTPRVASVLRDIFDATRDEQVREISSSPIAETEDINDFSEFMDESPVVESEAGLPLLQRQMYRTDI